MGRREPITMPLSEARDTLARLHCYSTVCGESAGALAQLREAVGRGTDPLPEQRWELAACTHEPAPGAMVTAFDGMRMPAVGPDRSSLSAVLEALPEGHPLLPRLLRADDALSDYLANRRWAVALGWFWGVDGQAYARAIERHCSTEVPAPGARFEHQQRLLDAEEVAHPWTGKRVLGRLYG